MEFPTLEFIWGYISRIATSDNVLMTAMVIPFLYFGERWYAAHRVSASHYRFGLLFFAVNATLLGLIAPVFSYLTATVVQSLGYGLIDISAWGFDGIAGSLLALLISTFVMDFFYYWFHRTVHKSKILWEMHLLHHSDENMNMLTAQRGHIFETLLSPIFITLPMAVLFQMPALDIAILSLIPQAYHFISHANVRLGYGRFWWVLISPDYHRIHHSIEPQHRDKNFANWFPVWDVLFGTLYKPLENERPETGVKGTKVVGLWQAYMLPIMGWRRMIKAAAQRKRGQ